LYFPYFVFNEICTFYVLLLRNEERNSPIQCIRLLCVCSW